MLGAETSIHDEIDDDLRAQCAPLGIDPVQLVSQIAKEGGPPPFELWPEHLDAYEVFFACRRQWRVEVGMGGAYFQGLDFSAVDVVMKHLGIPRKRQREVFLQVQVMEDEGVKVLNA
ncbi:DUF1799 domain-containing protein [Variovorax paradoxus]|uniref:DUF1799 domain-containing protein n=1 Tax=Variovorax paradoxus TaxID=34073 RepID=A0A0H2M5J3_VARPD|nr:DUF1799 domain-containing protein [Variovorax paradoxus]KLN57618.1 hypothetical protein VPARA_11310 [Variovorax paradoxus]